MPQILATVHTVTNHPNGTILICDGDDGTTYLRWLDETDNPIHGWHITDVEVGSRVLVTPRSNLTGPR